MKNWFRDLNFNERLYVLLVSAFESLHVGSEAIHDLFSNLIRNLREEGVTAHDPREDGLEQLFEAIHVDANLASAWTPYEFYVNDKFSHCGVNSFQLVKLKGNWVITYLIDTRRREACK